ncbi:MAG: radical SAM protein [Archaeoglobaceae archaeon]
MKVAIVDGYVDEPSCLGVPPYIAPYPRYIYGMLKDFGVTARYFTIDQLRENPKLKSELKSYDLQIIIGGVAVPGKYLGGRPLEKREVFSLNFANRNFLVGPLAIELSPKEVDQLADCNIEVVPFPFEKKLHEILTRTFGSRPFDLDRFSILGAEVVRQHPDYPHVVCEMETYRGCYWARCSFCIERFQSFWMRDARAVVAEMEALYREGVRHFRLGRQTDFFAYLADFSYDVPKPNPEAMKAFHEAIWRACPKIRTLHLDNVNPKTVATWKEEAREIVKTIVIYQTPGNVAAMGLESADERVVRENRLCATPEEVLEAVRILNEYGASPGYNGLPYFLPGLNFVIGLKGETKRTFEENLNFVRELLEQNLLVRRINVRQVKILPGTPMEKVGYGILRRHKRFFRSFKSRIRELENEMLKRVVPKFRKLTDLRVEVEGKVSYARQLATYPLLVGLIGKFRRNEFVDARVVDYGYRSVTAVRVPLNPNKASYEELNMLLGEKAKLIVVRRPFRSFSEVKELVGSVADLIFEYSEAYDRL